MGLTSSKEVPDELNLRHDQFPWDEVDPATREPWPEKDRLQLLAMAKAVDERVTRELSALFPPGESSTDQSKEGDKEREEDEVIARFCEFMKRGECKESFKALEDCVNEIDSIVKCTKHFPKLIKCVDAHSDYYQPIIVLAESAVKQIAVELEAFKEQEKLVMGD